jgi:hypothetical protein
MEILQPFYPNTLEISAHEGDIRRYIEVKIAQDRHKEAMDDGLQDEITKQLASRSQKSWLALITWLL